MKKCIAVLLAFVLVCSMVPLGASASQVATNRLDFEDGSYVIIKVTENPMRASGSKSGNKEYTFYDSNGTAHWKATLHGSYSYTGSSAKCTSSSMDVAIYKNGWSVLSKSSSKSGNTASGYANMGEKVLGVIVREIPVSLSLTCDANGNLS